MPKSTSWANRLDRCQLFGLPTTPVAPVSSREESSRCLTRIVSACDADGLSTQVPTHEVEDLPQTRTAIRCAQCRRKVGPQARFGPQFSALGDHIPDALQHARLLASTRT